LTVIIYGLTLKSGRGRTGLGRFVKSPEVDTMEALATVGIIAVGIVVAVGLSYASMQAVVSLMPSSHVKPGQK